MNWFCSSSNKPLPFLLFLYFFYGKELRLYLYTSKNKIEAKAGSNLEFFYNFQNGAPPPHLSRAMAAIFQLARGKWSVTLRASPATSVDQIYNYSPGQLPHTWLILCLDSRQFFHPYILDFCFLALMFNLFKLKFCSTKFETPVVMESLYCCTHCPESNLTFSWKLGMPHGWSRNNGICLVSGPDRCKQKRDKYHSMSEADFDYFGHCYTFF